MTMTEFPEEAKQKLIAYLDTHELPKGLGSEEAACSVAAINLALTGELKDDIPPCMSRVIGKWIIRIQDAMPADMRNSQEWKSLLPLAAGTGREHEHEQERRKIIVNWLWETVMPYFLPNADRLGFGEEWREMLEKRDVVSVRKARDIARVVRDQKAYADAAADAAAADAADAAADAADAAYAYAYAYAADAAYAYAADAAADAYKQYWTAIDPCDLLRKLIEVSEPQVA